MQQSACKNKRPAVVNTHFFRPLPRRGSKNVDTFKNKPSCAICQPGVGDRKKQSVSRRPFPLTPGDLSRKLVNRQATESCRIQSFCIELYVMRIKLGNLEGFFDNYRINQLYSFYTANQELLYNMG